jgi:histidyl-tRNA synthetase
MSKVHLPKGMRDLLPAQLNHRLEVIATIQAVFRRHGFEPLETPAMERIETLMGKYGDEGDKLVFQVLKRGEGGKRGEVDQALRYDLTVPLARVIAMNPALPMPFKRSQIQPVWRADRPQRGRFREFYQCDVDIVGSTSPMADAECLAVVHAALTELGFGGEGKGFRIRLNDRRILAAMAAAIDATDRESDMLVAIDKLDKIGREGVATELAKREFSESQVTRIFDMLDGGEIPGIDDIEAELRQIQDWAHAMGVDPARLTYDRTLARGLDYYTGPVFETVLTDGGIGSISGGGRYDELIGMFSGRPIPAVGVSLGLERLFVLMQEWGMVPEATTSTEVWVTVFSEESTAASLAATTAFREAGVNTEIALGGGKLGKQFKAAQKKGVPWVIVIGPDEHAAGKVQLKHMASGDQEVLPLDEAITKVKAG